MKKTKMGAFGQPDSWIIHARSYSKIIGFHTMTLKQRIILFLATGGYLGNIPFMPGTFGTLAAIPFILVFSQVPHRLLHFSLIILILAAIWIADEAENILKQKDPGCIVIDEVAGYSVAMAALPITWQSLTAGFMLFRFFDILKPFPVNYFERNYSGGAGVVLDDVVAGLMAALVLQIVF